MSNDRLEQLVVQLEELADRLASATLPQAPLAGAGGLVDRVLSESQSVRTKPIVGWRCWRILPYETLTGEASVRLCAVGTLGLPKVWEPLAPTRAVCSAYDSHHAAPRFDHECGVWALSDRTAARRRMVAFMQSQGGDPVGWAFGQVSLWGRVIEHAEGYRAEFAYPLALTVECPDERVAAMLRGLYAVDVEWAGGSLFEKAAAKRRRIDDELAAAAQAREAERRRLLARAEKLLAESEARRDALLVTISKKERPPGRPVPRIDPTEDDVLLAIFAHAAWRAYESRKNGWDAREREQINGKYVRRGVWAPTAQPGEIVSAILHQHGFFGPAGKGYGVVLHLTTLRMRAMVEAGLLIRGSSSTGDPHKESLALTGAGLERLERLDRPERLTTRAADNRATRPVTITTRGTMEALRRPRLPFAFEIDELRPQWAAERRAARAAGEQAYRDLVDRWHQEPDITRLIFDDEEVADALARAVAENHGDPVAFEAMWRLLSPVKATASEAALHGQRLHRLAKAGRAVRDQTDKTWART